MKKFSKSHHGTMHELNITPLLDLAFVLLVIFIITTTPMVNDLDLNLPTKTTAKKPPQQKPNFLIVEADGRVFLNGKEEDLGALRNDLLFMKRQDPDTSVVVHGDAAVLYQRMVKVFDILQRADVTKVGLATERPAAAKLPTL
jgi:biopolymer transport protein ExbD